jgi:hypothetical protein
MAAALAVMFACGGMSVEAAPGPQGLQGPRWGYLAKEINDKIGTTSDGAIVKADASVGTNLTNLDAGLANETAARIGADKSQDAVIETVNNNLVTAVTAINKNVSDGFTTLNAADTAINEKIGTTTTGTYVKETNSVGQNLNALDGQVANNTTAISNEASTRASADNSLSKRISDIDTRNKQGIAGVAALAALHPLDFDPDAKWDFAAGYGNYRGENSAAVGAFYRPNEDFMLSVGGTIGNGDENSVNAGLTIKLGAGSSHVNNSKTAMAKEIKDLRAIVEKQDAQMQKMAAMFNAFTGMNVMDVDQTKMFPDVPANHWAYQAVQAMANTGLIEGYPDGEFKGDRTLTRYEFAQVVYRALQKGAEVDARLMKEFAPELKYFHIDTIHKDKAGNPTVQRVRVNK